MSPRVRFAIRAPRRIAFLACLVSFAMSDVAAQEADPLPTKRDTTAPEFPNTIPGELTPGSGFDIIRTKRGSLNISMYGLFRYVTQNPPNQMFVDHLGRVRDVNPRNDINWHRQFTWLTGFFWTPKFRYTIANWSLPTTQSTLLFGNFQYMAAKQLTIGVGVAPNLTARSLQGSWPFWASSDRLMAEEFFRGGFSSGVWATGEILPRFWYNVSITNNISELGVTQANDTRNMGYSGSVRWQPTTGEFGPRNGFGDFEYHTRVATQFGTSMETSRESRYAPIDQPPNNTQIRISDGLNPFDFGALADGVTVQTLTYRELAIDAGVKYRGGTVMGEYYFRTLNDFVATGPLPLRSIYDHGFMAEASYMVLPKTVMVYVVGSYIADQFKRYPHDIGGGISYYPSQTRSWRLNMHVLNVYKSPASTFFGFYLAGLSGTVFSLGIDMLL